MITINSAIYTEEKIDELWNDLMSSKDIVTKPFKHLIKKYSNICKSLKDKLPEPLDKEELEFNADVY